MMNNGATIWYGEVVEDKPFSFLARVASLSGTGSEQARGEGPVVKSADVQSIACTVTDIGADRDGTAGTEITPAPALTSANVFDVLRTAGWASDAIGYNFRHDVGVTFTVSPAVWLLLEYAITLTDGTVIPLELRVYVRPRIA